MQTVEQRKEGVLTAKGLHLFQLKRSLTKGGLRSTCQAVLPYIASCWWPTQRSKGHRPRSLFHICLFHMSPIGKLRMLLDRCAEIGIHLPAMAGSCLRGYFDPAHDVGPEFSQ